MKTSTGKLGYTLIELLVVIGIISLLLVIVLPTTAAFFRTGSEASARNLINSQLSTARSFAIRDRRITGVHFQPHYDTDNKKEIWMAAIQDSGSGFDLIDGVMPMALTSGWDVGNISDAYVDNNEYRSDVAYDADFRTFTVLFDPDGRLITRDVAFNTDSLLFKDDDDDNQTKIWNVPAQHTSIRALCLFDTAQLLVRATDSEKAEYLNENARFLPVNPYTGGLIRIASE